MWAEIGTGSAVVGLVGIIFRYQYNWMKQQKNYLFQRDGRSIYVPRVECSQIGDRIFNKLDVIERKQDISAGDFTSVLVKLARIEEQIKKNNGNKK